MLLQGSTVESTRVEVEDTIGGGVNRRKLKKIGPTRRRWVSECCGVVRSAICIIPPEVVPLALVSGSDMGKEIIILTDCSQQISVHL